MWNYFWGYKNPGSSAAPPEVVPHVQLSILDRLERHRSVHACWVTIFPCGLALRFLLLLLFLLYICLQVLWGKSG